jgi:cytochrome c-type biogenesis protein CcmH
MLLVCTCGFFVVRYFFADRQWTMFCAILLFIPLSTGLLYLETADGLKNIQWLAQQHRHQALVKQFNELGSIDEIIARIQQRLQSDPNNAEGYYWLGRLYQVQNKPREAEEAFANVDRITQEIAVQ